MNCSITLYYKYLVFFLIMGVFPGLMSTPIHTNYPLNNHSNKEVWLTVFVHGIISIKPHVTVTNFLRFLNDNVSESLYGETVELMREDQFFFQNQTIQKRGLHKINPHNLTPGGAASLMVSLYEDTNKIYSPTTQNHYYTYGWSGLLSRSARYKDAKEFINQLEKEIAKYKAQGINPKVRLIGYSHGGTIILKLAMVKQYENLHPNFIVDEAFLVGTPIQFDTDYLIADPLYKKVYNIFSRSDRVQKLDFFSCGHFFSEHSFKPHYGFEELPQKLTQIEIRVIRKKGEGCLPITNQEHPVPLLFDGARCSRSVRNVSPGHTELWFFGWTPLNYRKTFPFYPMPIVAFLPFIIHSIKPFESTFNPIKPLTLTLDPRRNSMVLINHCPRETHVLPFIGVDNFLKLKEKTLLYKPDPELYNWNAFNEHVAKAYSRAIFNLRTRRCKKYSEPLSLCVP